MGGRWDIILHNSVGDKGEGGGETKGVCAKNSIIICTNAHTQNNVLYRLRWGGEKEDPRPPFHHLPHSSHAARIWPLQYIAITDMVWHVLQWRMVGGEHCIAQ